MSLTLRNLDMNRFNKDAAASASLSFGSLSAGNRFNAGAQPQEVGASSAVDKSIFAKSTELSGSNTLAGNSAINGQFGVNPLQSGQEIAGVQGVATSGKEGLVPRLNRLDFRSPNTMTETQGRRLYYIQ